MKKYILNANTLLDGLIGTPAGLKQFIKLTEMIEKNKAEWYSIPLITYEINNLLRYKFTSLASDKIIEHINSFNIHILEFSNTMENLAREIAYKTGYSFYTASYHACACLNDMVFLTVNDKYIEKGKIFGNVESFYKIKF